MVIDDRRMPEDVRRQAEELKGLVYKAYKALKRGGDDLSSISMVAEQAVDEEWLLSEGQRLLQAGNWARADAVLTRAHRIRIDNPIVLSNLGWARFHNPNREPDTREDEAIDLLILATQFDPLDVNARFYLACALKARSDLEAALRQVIQGLRIRPEHVALNALLKELNAQS
jgi:tetratricopeptide (TPR) repeat protein